MGSQTAGVTALLSGLALASLVTVSSALAQSVPMPVPAPQPKSYGPPSAPRPPAATAPAPAAQQPAKPPEQTSSGFPSFFKPPNIFGKSGETTARNAGLETLRLGVDQPAEFRGAFQGAVDAKADAMLVHSSPIFVDQAAAIAELGREFRLPTIGLFPIYAKAGGLVSYGPNNFELFRQVGAIVAKILRGAKPSEFPIQRPVYLSFLINMHTAKLLQLSIPASLSALADEVIE